MFTTIDSRTQSQERCALSGSVALDEHLTLEPLMQAHAEAVSALAEESVAEIARWLPWAAASRDFESVRTSLAAVEERRKRGAGIAYAILKGGEFAGVIDLHAPDPSDCANVGYWLGTRFTGGGIMTKALVALTEIAFREYKLHRVVVVTAVDNVRSRRVAERAGFTLESIQRERLKILTGYVDAALYVRLAEKKT